MVELNERQKQIINKYTPQFVDFLNTAEGIEGKKDREQRRSFFKKVLSKENASDLSKDDFGRIIEKMWASDVWGDKDYYVNKLLSDNGLPKLRSELKELLYGSHPLDKRFDRFNKSVKGLGPSSITEILTFVFPSKCGMWTKSHKSVLPFLKMKTLLPDRVYKYPINGGEYLKCNEVLRLAKDELDQRSGLESVDFVDTDFFMWFVFSEVMKFGKAVPQITEKEEVEFPIVEEMKTEELTHWDVMGILTELGNLLGFETYVADPSRRHQGKTLGEIATLREIPGFTFQDTLDIVRNIDVIWFKGGEYPEHCFEVEHTTNIRDGLLRLYQISGLKGVNFFIIAPFENTQKFQKEVARKPFKEIKDRYTFRSYKELVRWFAEAKTYHKLKNDFLGLS